MGGRRCGRGARGLRRASGPFVRLMTAAKAAITFITQKTGSSTALSTPCALPMTLSKSDHLASEAYTYFFVSKAQNHNIWNYVSTTKPDASFPNEFHQRRKGWCVILLNQLFICMIRTLGIPFNTCSTTWWLVALVTTWYLRQPVCTELYIANWRGCVDVNSKSGCHLLAKDVKAI